MKKITCFLLAGLFAGSIFGAIQVNIPIFEKAPVVDGYLNEECWKKAFIYECVKSIENKELKDKWKVLIGCNTSAIYIGIDADISEPDKILKLIKTRDGMVWKDDCFEIMIDYRNESTSYAQFLMNTIGVKCDLFRFHDSDSIDPQNFDADWQGICQVKGNKIHAEFQIPYSIFDLYDKKDNDFRINICRENKYQNEDSSISGTFSQIDKFFVLKNLPIPQELKQVKIHDVNWGINFGPNVLTAKLTNSSRRDITYKIVMFDRNGSLIDTAKKGIIRSGETVTIEKNYYIGEPSRTREITLCWMDTGTGNILRSMNKVFILSPAVSAFTDKYAYDETDKQMELKIRLNFAREMLKDARMKILFPGRNKLLWQSKFLEPEMSVVLDIKNVPFGKNKIVMIVERGKLKIQKVILFQKVKSPFYREAL